MFKVKHIYPEVVALRTQKRGEFFISANYVQGPMAYPPTIWMLVIGTDGTIYTVDMNSGRMFIDSIHNRYRRVDIEMVENTDTPEVIMPGQYVPAEFYMVFNEGGGQTPAKKHPLAADARREAVRLTGVNHKPSYVLAPVAKAEAQVTVAYQPLTRKD